MIRCWWPGRRRRVRGRGADLQSLPALVTLPMRPNCTRPVSRRRSGDAGVASLQLSEAVLVDLGLAMGPVIASIHEKESEFRSAIMDEAAMEHEPTLGRRRLRDVGLRWGSNRRTPPYRSGARHCRRGAGAVEDDDLCEIERRNTFQAGDVDAQLVGVRAALVMRVNAADRAEMMFRSFRVEAISRELSSPCVRLELSGLTSPRPRLASGKSSRCNGVAEESLRNGDAKRTAPQWQRRPA